MLVTLARAACAVAMLLQSRCRYHCHCRCHLDGHEAAPFSCLSYEGLLLLWSMWHWCCASSGCMRGLGSHTRHTEVHTHSPRCSDHSATAGLLLLLLLLLLVHVGWQMQQTIAWVLVLVLALDVTSGAALLVLQSGWRCSAAARRCSIQSEHCHCLQPLATPAGANRCLLHLLRKVNAWHLHDLVWNACVWVHVLQMRKQWR